jgi:hypothetical protein
MAYIPERFADHGNDRRLKLVSPLPDNAENLAVKAQLYWGLGMSYSARFELA